MTRAITPESLLEKRRARYERLIALRDRVDRIAAKACHAIHREEKDKFWRGVNDSSEAVRLWPSWKRDMLNGAIDVE